MFTCTLIITGLDYVAEARAASKKDAQSKAAWNFCEHLVKTGYMTASELPPRPYESGPKDSSGVSTEAIGSLPPETPEDVERHGGWNLANCRQRLNQFCQREHYGPDFRHEIHGPEHSRIFVCELSLYVSAVRKEFYANERGSNKKQATAVCSLSMVRQLYKQGLIEKFGEPFKHVTRGALLNAKLIEMDELDMMIDGNANAGLKRKAEAEPENVDENGNWTTEHSRQRLNQFCQVNNMPCDVIYSEEGQTGSKSYTASLTLKVKPEGSTEEQDVAAEAVGQSKKAAAQGCALKIISQLYKLKLVEANAWAEALPNKKIARISQCLHRTFYECWCFDKHTEYLGWKRCPNQSGWLRKPKQSPCIN
uniref:DRBM domain-containing protein n=1 Tax=Ciona savignyi TaxID=51511 RepID=H2Z307_CIOSA